MKPTIRILALLGPDSDIERLKQVPGMTSIIIRRRTNAVEVDFHTFDPDSIRDTLNGITEVRDFRILDEETVQYSREYFQSVLEREEEIIMTSRAMFRQERYWEAHTVLEHLWKALSGNMKKTVQGVIIIAASMTHFQMGEPDVAESMFKKGIDIIHSSTGKLPHEYGFPDTFAYPVNMPEVF